MGDVALVTSVSRFSIVAGEPEVVVTSGGGVGGGGSCLLKAQSTGAYVLYSRQKLRSSS